MSSPMLGYPEHDPIPMRIQVACHGVLVAEVVAEAFEFDTFYAGIWQRYAKAKHRAGKPVGGAIIQRADLPRLWNVPVGSAISFSATEARRKAS